MNPDETQDALTQAARAIEAFKPRLDAGIARLADARLTLKALKAEGAALARSYAAAVKGAR